MCLPVPHSIFDRIVHFYVSCMSCCWRNSPRFEILTFRDIYECCPVPFLPRSEWRPPFKRDHYFLAITSENVGKGSVDLLRSRDPQNLRTALEYCRISWFWFYVELTGEHNNHWLSNIIALDHFHDIHAHTLRHAFCEQTANAFVVVPLARSADQCQNTHT